MGHSYSWYHASRHATYNKGDVIKIQGTYYTSADGEEKYGSYASITSRYFYSYYTASWTVVAPICFSYAKDHAWAFCKPSIIVSGGTLDTYSIKYDANGGTGAPSSQTKTYGIDLTLRTGIPTKAGHNFLGWSTSNTATSATYKAGDKYTANKGVTLYAVWSPYKHTVSFNANGGTGAPSSQTKTYGKILTLSSIQPTRDGYDFLGWGTNSKDTLIQYNPGDKYGLDYNGGTVTLYAKWSPHTYKVEYSANGGSFAPNSQLKYHDKALTLRSEVPTRQYYTFLGWGTSSASTEVAYEAGATYTEEKNITLYAIWELNSYTITYYLLGGVQNSNNKTTCVIGTTLTLYKPTRKGYTFIGWHLGSMEGDLVTEIDINNTENITLFAEWKINQYRIIINPNGGTYEGNTTNSAVYAYYGNTIELKTPTKEGSVFQGWNISGAGSLKDSIFTLDEGNCTLTAMWDLETKIVNYDANGGLIEGEDHSSYVSVVYQYGDDISLHSIPDTKRPNYIFLGWFTDIEGGTKVVSPYSVTSNMTLYAHWKYNKTANVFNGSLYKSGVPFIKDNLKEGLSKGVIYVFKDGKFQKGGNL